MATREAAIAAFGRRHGYAPGKAAAVADVKIQNAVDDQLAGDMTALDRLPDELRQFARDIYEERYAAGEGAPGAVRISGLTGGRA